MKTLRCAFDEINVAQERGKYNGIKLGDTGKKLGLTLANFFPGKCKVNSVYFPPGFRYDEWQQQGAKKEKAKALWVKPGAPFSLQSGTGKRGRNAKG